MLAPGDGALRSRIRSVAASGLAALAGIAAVPGVAAAAARHTDARYALANGCDVMRSRASGKLVTKAAGGYAATATTPAAAEHFRMRATALGSYLLYGSKRDVLARAGSGNGIVVAADPSPAADWTVRDAGPRDFTLTAQEQTLAAGSDGTLRTGGGSGDATRFSFEPVSGCADYPEAEVGATGPVAKGATPYAQVHGFLDAHSHLSDFEFLGGSIHCGRPWHPYGIAYALPDCASTEGPKGTAAPVQNFLNYGSPVHPHDTVGWPTFKDWPTSHSLTYEQTYYKWLERAWRGGLRLDVNLLSDNRVLCELLPQKRHSCDEMATTRLEAHDMMALQDYIDAQSGGPGKGWFRLVHDPWQARKVINEGKLAVVFGMETSELFGCREVEGEPKCNRKQIDAGLDEFYALGVRDLEIVNKFDNALSGVRFDSGPIGILVNAGQRLSTGQYFSAQTCSTPEHDNTLLGATPQQTAFLATTFGLLVPAGSAPVYPPAPNCNTKGLTALGEYLIRRMIAKHMIVDPDHMSVLGVNQTLSLLESQKYSGVVSSHSWMDPLSWPRVYALGGVVTPYAGSSVAFVDTWKKTRGLQKKPYFFGYGYGDDMNGFGGQGAARGAGAANPVRYPFKSFDGKVTFTRQRTGQRTFDINSDGVAQYGLYPDWIEDLRMLAGRQIVADMDRGAETYLEMWERANGVPRPACRASAGTLSRHGFGRLRLGATVRAALLAAGQPATRPGRAYRYCVTGESHARVSGVFSKAGRLVLVVSTGKRHSAGGVRRGARVAALRARGARSLGHGLWVAHGGGFVYVVHGGRVRSVGAAASSLTTHPARLRAALRQS